jgi:hypothetical protein
MPRVQENVLDCVFYLYPSVDDAKSGRNFGGTGFFIFVPEGDGDEHVGRGWIYAVTNWHVAVRDGSSVIRINTKNGNPEILELGPEQWEFDPRFDVAVLPIQLDENIHKYSLITTRIFCSQHVAANQGIGPGDDVFMLGRFIDHDGGATNKPALRFGHISINPTPMKQPNGRSTDAYCIDMHSRTGYSGSPVFAYRTPGNTLDNLDRDPAKRGLLLAGVNYFGLLGIHFAQFPELWELETMKKITISSADSLISDARPEYIRGMSGMTCVLPAWVIAEVLNMPKLKQYRGGHELHLTFGHSINRLPDPPTASNAPGV